MQDNAIPHPDNQWRENDISIADLSDEPVLSDDGRRELMERKGGDVMNKKEQAMVDDLREQLRIAKALRWTEKVEPDVPIPESSYLTKGFLCNGYNGDVVPACSSRVSHGYGSDERTGTQGARALYSTRLLALRAVRHLVELKVAKVLADVDGRIEKEVAGVSGRNFEKIVCNIRDAREVRDSGGYGCGLYASSIMLDGEQGLRMQEAVEGIRPYVDEHYWLPLFSFGGQTDFGTPVRGNPGRLDNMREPLPCWSVFNEGHVTSAGDISLCCFDSHKRWVVGNLATSTFMQAWNCQEAQDLRAAHLKKDVTGTACEHCAIGG